MGRRRVKMGKRDRNKLIKEVLDYMIYILFKEGEVSMEDEEFFVSRELAGDYYYFGMNRYENIIKDLENGKNTYKKRNSGIKE